MSERKKEFVAEELWLLIAVLTVGITALAGAIGLPDVIPGVLAILGFVILTPLFLFWGEEIAELWLGESEASQETTAPDALSELKRRYSQGEIDDEESERRIDRLLELDDDLDRGRYRVLDEEQTLEKESEYR